MAALCDGEEPDATGGCAVWLIRCPLCLASSSRVLETVPEDVLARSQGIIDKLNGAAISNDDGESPQSVTEETKNLDLLF